MSLSFSKMKLLSTPFIFIKITISFVGKISTFIVKFSHSTRTRKLPLISIGRKSLPNKIMLELFLVFVVFNTGNIYCVFHEKLGAGTPSIIFNLGGVIDNKSPLTVPNSAIQLHLPPLKRHLQFL